MLEIWSTKQIHATLNIDREWPARGAPREDFQGLDPRQAEAFL